MSRIRGLAALALLLLGLVGIPVALVGLITIVGWIAWLVFAVSVVIELVALLSGQRIRLSLPGLAGPQRVAAGLLVSVIAMVAAPPMVPPQPMGTTLVAAAAP